MVAQSTAHMTRIERVRGCYVGWHSYNAVASPSHRVDMSISLDYSSVDALSGAANSYADMSTMYRAEHITGCTGGSCNSVTLASQQLLSQ